MHPSAGMAELAAAVGVSRATLFRRFPSRESLVASRVETGPLSVTPTLSRRPRRPEDGPSGEALTRVIRGLAAIAPTHGLLALQVRFRRHSRRSCWRQRKRWIARILSIVRRGQRAGELRTDFPPAWVLTMLTWLCIGAADGLRLGTLAAGRRRTPVHRDRAWRAGVTMTGSRRWVVLATLCLAVLLVAIDATVLNLAIPAITTDLDASATQMLWILDIYSLVLAGLLVSAGALSDRLGRRRVLLAGCALFGAASAAAAFAPSAETLIAARALMGIGGAAIMPSTLAIIRSVFEVPRERTLAIGLWSAMAAAGAAVGPIVGGVLLERFWWGSVFLINLPVLAVLLIVGARLLPELPQCRARPLGLGGRGASLDGRPGRARARDQAGLAKDGLTWTGSAGVRRSQHPPSCGSSAGNSGVGAPLVDVRLFRRHAFSGAVLGNLISLLALSGLLLFLFQHLQLVDGLSPLAAGLPAAAAHAWSPGRRAARRAARAPSRGRGQGSGRWARIVRRGHDRVRVDARSALRRPGCRLGGGGRRRARGARPRPATRS